MIILWLFNQYFNVLIKENNVLSQYTEWLCMQLFAYVSQFTLTKLTFVINIILSYRKSPSGDSRHFNILFIKNVLRVAQSRHARWKLAATRDETNFFIKKSTSTHQHIQQLIWRFTISRKERKRIKWTYSMNNTKWVIFAKPAPAKIVSGKKLIVSIEKSRLKIILSFLFSTSGISFWHIDISPIRIVQRMWCHFNLHVHTSIIQSDVHQYFFIIFNQKALTPFSPNHLKFNYKKYISINVHTFFSIIFTHRSYRHSESNNGIFPFISTHCWANLTIFRQYTNSTIRTTQALKSMQIC